MAESAHDKLQPSKLSGQLELLADDLDLASLKLNVKGRAALEIRHLLTGGDVERTIQGASTVTLNVNDRDRTLLQGGYLVKDCDIRIDGLWFRLKSVGKQVDDLTLTFEDREVAILRTYPKPGAPHNGFRVWDANKVFRVPLARELVREARPDLDIRFVSPSADVSTPPKTAKDLPSQQARDHARGLGFGPVAQIEVKGRQATAEQAGWIDAVLQVGVTMKARRKILVTAVMVITQESLTAGGPRATNGTHVGLFQQDPRYWPATRDTVKDATAFFTHCIGEDKNWPSVSYAELGELVQASGRADLYAQWRTEAEHTVTAWGIAGAASTPTLPAGGGTHQFIRGAKTKVASGKVIYTREDNWTMLQRLATEVGWRCFAVSGAVYLLPDTDLLASRPRMSLTEKTPGVESIDGTFDEGAKQKRKALVVKPAFAQVTVSCRIGRWAAPPGTVVELAELGPFNGRWLVSDIRRPLFTNLGMVTLVKPQPVLPEGLSSEYRTASGGPPVWAPPSSGAISPGGKYVAAGSLVRPIPKDFNLSPFPPAAAPHPTMGLPGYPAYDFMAHAGSPVIAPESGTIRRFAGYNPAVGPVGGPGGALGWSIYLKGDSGTDYFITHLATRTVTEGSTVQIAQQIGTVADWKKWANTPDHVHVGVNGGKVTIEMLGAAPLAEKISAADVHQHGGA